LAQQVQSVQWVPINNNAGLSVAIVSCDGSVSNDWVIQPNGTDNSGDAVNAVAFSVDNTANINLCTVIFGPFELTVAPFTRQTFPIPNLTGSVEILITAGVVTVIFFQSASEIPDAANLLAIQKAAAPTLTFPVVPVTASRAQQASDYGSTLLFSSGAGLNYTLLAANSLTNGASTTFSNKGTNIVQVIPNGADTINGIYNAANPLILYPGDHVDFFCDGATFWASGEIAWESNEMALVVSTLYNPTHTLRVVPKHYEIFLRCKVANQGYNPGDELLFSTGYGSQQDGTGQSSVSIVFSASNMNLRIPNWNVNPTVINSTNTYGNIALVDWVFFVRAYARI
jgi:hypothetical protein